MKNSESLFRSMGVKLGLSAFMEMSEKELREVLWSTGLIVVSGFPADPALMLSRSKCFGRPDKVHPRHHRLQDEEFVRLQSNIKGHGVNGGGMYWHSDGPWNSPPTRVTLLYCSRAPHIGGDTLFADMQESFDRLESKLKSRVIDAKSWMPCKTIRMREVESGLRDSTAGGEFLADVFRPLVISSPQTGKSALYFNEAAIENIVGLSKDESGELLRDIVEHCAAEEVVYQHKWLEGDLLIWDNYRVMHKATKVGSAMSKITWRVTVSEG